MVLGALWCPANNSRETFEQIRAIKTKHGLAPLFEIKWSKISPAKLEFYLDLINYFFKREDLHFRALIALDKGKLTHEQFNQNHDTWYYKMFFQLLSVIFDSTVSYNIFLDIKDTRSSEKMLKLHEILCNDKGDFSHDIIKVVQTVRSHEVELLQLADLLLGAVSYANRGLLTSKAKLQVINRIEEFLGHSLRTSTQLKEDKFNLFFWKPQITGETNV